jgi:hypothetical protein
MTAASRLKQLLFIAAALALVALGFAANLATATPARATGGNGGECIPTQDTLSAWADEGEPFKLHDATPPTDPDGTDEASTTNLVRFVLVGTSKHVTQAAVAGTPATALQRHSWNPQGPVDESIASPTWPVPQQGKWQANTSNYNGTDPLGVPFQQGGGNGGDNASWFYWTFTPATPGQAEVSHTDYNWQKQTRTFTAGVDCPPPADDKKVVVCKYVGTPPGTPDHIIVVSASTLGKDWPGTFPFAFGDAQDSIAIRPAVGNEQPGDEELAKCPGFQPPPDVCPADSDHPGQVIGEGETEQEVCFDVEEPDVCPADSDHPGQVIGEGETEKVCDDEKPPVVVPDDGVTPPKAPSNHPGNGPTVKGVQGPTTVAGTPAVRVPTAVDAGLSAPEREPAGTGGALALLGITTALFGAVLVGVSLRPRRGRSLTG